MGRKLSKADVMEFLDKHPGKLYSAREIHKRFRGKLNLSKIHSNLKNITKREEYRVERRSPLPQRANTRVRN